ncbi:hypothetical protein GE09DRAFT_315698 [Coniochaeta sp. 2T2.1]|nr:hypothetical protein GE09DRAFT_315698 [Coniochaeta sp. 2T2.1]
MTYLVSPKLERIKTSRPPSFVNLEKLTIVLKPKPSFPSLTPFANSLISPGAPPPSSSSDNAWLVTAHISSTSGLIPHRVSLSLCQGRLIENRPRPIEVSIQSSRLEVARFNNDGRSSSTHDCAEAITFRAASSRVCHCKTAVVPIYGHARVFLLEFVDFRSAMNRIRFSVTIGLEVCHGRLPLYGTGSLRLGRRLERHSCV